jgi:hypothetical protein
MKTLHKLKTWILSFVAVGILWVQLQISIQENCSRYVSQPLGVLKGKTAYKRRIYESLVEKVQNTRLNLNWPIFLTHTNIYQLIRCNRNVIYSALR